MILIAMSLTLLSILCFYVAASRTELNPSVIPDFLSKYPQLLRILGWTFTVASLLLFAVDLGLAKGVFTVLVLWPTLASVIILLVPFFQNKIVKN
ncbi:MAG: hypothetical protein AAGC43_18570 [Bacteroidota bacterium]